MKRLSILLPLAALFVLGSCRDSANPVSIAPAVVGAANAEFTPMPETVLGANSAGTSVMQGNGPFVIRTPFGGASENTTSFIFWHIDEAGTLFGWASDASVYYRKEGGARVVIALPEAGQTRLSFGIGRTLAGGEVVMAIQVSDPTAEPASQTYKTYRYHSTNGWDLIAASLSDDSPSGFAPRAMALTADGSLVWTRPVLPFNKRYYRTDLSGNTMQYQIPVGHTDGTQYAASNGNSRATDGIGLDGSMVGYSYQGATAHPILWAADGSYQILPNPGGAGYFARVINGDYIGGHMLSAGREYPVRWHWNGSSWDFNVFSGDQGTTLDHVHVSSSGMLVSSWPYGSPAGFSYGSVSDAAAFRATNDVLDYPFLFIDAGNRIWTSSGYMRATPELSAPSALTTAVGQRMNLPLRVVHGLGGATYPMTWSVRWQLGVNNQAQEGVVYNNGAIPLVRHIYTQPGVFTARAIIEDSEGDADTTITTVTVYGSEARPVASVNTRASVPEGDDLVFNAGASSDPNSLPLTYTWQFDGAGAAEGQVFKRRNVPRGDHTYRLIARNAAGLADTTTGEVTVYNIAPTGRFVWPVATINEGTAFTLTVKGLNDFPGDIVKVGYDCGDGDLVIQSASSYVCPGLPDQGTYMVRARLVDQGAGLFTEQSATVTARNKAPTVTITNLIDAGSGQWRLQYTATDASADSPLTITFQVNGVRRNGTQVSPPSGTSMKLTASPGDVLTVRARDKDGAIGSASYAIPF